MPNGQKRLQRAVALPLPIIPLPWRTLVDRQKGARRQMSAFCPLGTPRPPPPPLFCNSYSSRKYACKPHKMNILQEIFLRTKALKTGCF